MYDGIRIEQADTHCPYCALQCGMRLVPELDRLTVAARDFPTNKGGLCRKGWTAAELLYAPDRLTTPLMRERKGAPLRPASWDEALRSRGRRDALDPEHRTAVTRSACSEAAG